MATATIKVSHFNKVVDIPEDFSKAKKIVVPNQSMTLHEILRRFVRRESLPVMKEGTYQTGFGDLEKIQNYDITEKMDVVDKIKAYVKKGREMQKEREEMELQRAQGAQAPPAPPTPPAPPAPPPAE